MQLLQNSGVPAYIQIEEKIRMGIAQGVWKVGSILPTEEQLCETFSVSRGPVRQAMTRLVAKGIVKRERRIGTRVVRGVEHEGIVLITPFRAIEVAGMTPSNRVLKCCVEPIPAFLRSRWPDIERIVVFERLVMASGQPVTYGTSYLPAEPFSSLLETDMEHKALTDCIAEHGIILTKLEQTSELVRVMPADFEHLGLQEGSGCLQLSLCQWSDKRPIEYAYFRLAPDMSNYLISGLLRFEPRIAIRRSS